VLEATSIDEVPASTLRGGVTEAPLPEMAGAALQLFSHRIPHASGLHNCETSRIGPLCSTCRGCPVAPPANLR